MYKNDNLDVARVDKWNRKILNITWIIILIVSFTEIIAFILDSYFLGYVSLNYLKYFVIIPISINVTILSLITVIYAVIKDKYDRWIKYLMIVGCTLLACSIVCIHYEVSVVYVLFIFPIFLSELYRNKKLTYFAMELNLICYLTVAFLYLPLKPKGSYSHDYTDILAVITLIIATFIIVLSFIDRAEEVMESLIMARHNEQELSIKNFIMEFNSKIESATGLYNHKTFYEYLEQLMKQSVDYGFSLCLAVLDIDNFKSINDVYGHSSGDKVIAKLVEDIKENIAADDYAARYGGEEFAIIFTDKDEDKAFEVAEKIRLQFNSSSLDELNRQKISVSIGISQYEKGMSRDNFFENSDAALYEAKKSGKNKTIIFNE